MTSSSLPDSVLDALADSSLAEIDELQQRLNLDGATLQRRWLDEELLSLWLLSVDEAQQLGSEAIGQLWQNMPYWAFAWAGGRALAQYIVQNPEAVAGKRVLDFGCGSGIVAIAALQAGAKEAWVADTDPNAILAAHVNAHMNGILIHTYDMTSIALPNAPHIDLVMAADVLYDISSNKDLAKLLNEGAHWLCAEHVDKYNEQIGKNTVLANGCCIGQLTTSTLPKLGDFDESLNVAIFCSKNNAPILN
ncbi:MAG: 50S ribosomal protein L11 methyltransferase [Oleibacter sp.]|nr:50S ribosomal protein L11 methyltransferase [Thalassolituus sp.]